MEVGGVGGWVGRMGAGKGQGRVRGEQTGLGGRWGEQRDESRQQPSRCDKLRCAAVRCAAHRWGVAQRGGGRRKMWSGSPIQM